MYSYSIFYTTENKKKKSFYKDLLHTWYVPDSVLGAKNVILTKYIIFLPSHNLQSNRRDKP